MVKYSLDKVTSEMILAESIFLPSGELLLAARYRIRDNYKALLKQRGISSVFVEVKGTQKVIPETVISSHTQREMALSLSKLENSFLDAFAVQLEGSQAIEEFIKNNKHRLAQFLLDSEIGPKVDGIVQQILNEPATILNMADLLKVDANLFGHAMNVAVIALCIGKLFRFSTEEMRQLGLGAMHYDLGMVAVPRELLDKNDELTKEEMMAVKEHTTYGYLMLSKSPLLPATCSAIAMQHHEFQDGSGFPRGIKGGNSLPIKDLARRNMIHRYAEIVAVADTYEMLLSGRTPYSKPHPAIDAIKMVIALSGTKLNSTIVKALVSIIPLYPTGALIRVTHAREPHLIGYVGVVAQNHASRLSKPLIILFENRNHQRVDPILIDTNKSSEFHFELTS